MVSWRAAYRSGSGPGHRSGYRGRVPLVAAAVCPHPPLLVPEIAAGAAAEFDDLRRACARAVAGLHAARADTLVVIGGAAATGQVDPPFVVSFAPWGLPLRIGEDGEALPLSLAIGRWLLGAGSPAVLHTISFSAEAAACRTLGERLGERAGRVALLVMGDGSAGRPEPGSGPGDPRARPYDETVAAALAAADPAALLALDPALSAELLVAGRAAWQVLAGAALATGRAWRGELTYDSAPYGVGYFVASWWPA